MSTFRATVPGRLRLDLGFDVINVAAIFLFHYMYTVQGDFKNTLET